MTIEQIEQLEYNWDGCGALPIPKDIINNLKVLLPKLKYEPDIFPTPNGTVQLEYTIKSNRHLNIEILSNSNMEIFEMFDDHSCTEDMYKYDADLIISRVNKFMSIR